MAFKSILKPEGSIVAGIATGILVYAIWDRMMPDTATIHATKAHDINVAAARKKAAWTSAGVVAGIALLTRDTNVFILGGAVDIALDFHARHANACNPDTGKLDMGYASGFSGSQSQGYGTDSGPGRLTAVS